MTTMTQKLLPVMATGNRILGTVALDSQQDFTGSETSVSIKGKSYAIQYFLMARGSDDSAVQFMGIAMDATDERLGMQNHLPDFAEVSVNTPQGMWKIPGSLVHHPVQNESTWEKFLAALPAQDKSILPPLHHLQDA